METLRFSTSVPYEMRFRNVIADKMNCTYNVLNIDFLLHHNHDEFWEFTILTDGTLHNYLNGKQYTYEKGTLFFLTNDDCHHVKRKGNTQIRYINLMVKKDYLLGYINSISNDFLKFIIKILSISYSG